MDRCLGFAPPINFPKSVAIDNRRLYLLQGFAYVAIVAVVIYALTTQSVENTKYPQSRVTMWSDIGANNPVDGDEVCSELSKYDYSPGPEYGWEFRNATCMKICSDQKGTNCVRVSDVTSQSNDELFFATSYTEEKHLLYEGACVGGQPFQENDDAECRQTHSHIIPEVGNISAKFLLDYQIDLPSSTWHKFTGTKHLATTDLLTVVRRRSSPTSKEFTEMRRFEHGEVISLTLDEVLTAAGFSGVAALGNEASSEQGNEFPTNRASSGSAMPKAWVTGMDVALTLEFSNKYSEFGSDGPICVIDAVASQAWMPREVSSTLDTAGSIQTRTYHGVRLKFHAKGRMSWFQMQNLIFTFALGVFWTRIPFLLVFYFAVYFLGTLSDVYNGFLYEELDFHKEFAGVSARVLKTSYGITDFHDVQEEFGDEIGASQERAKGRMEMVFENIPGIDRSTVSRFARFFYQFSTSGVVNNTDVISRGDFLEFFGLKEEFPWDDIVGIFNSSIARNTLEKVFMDSTLGAFYKQETRIGHQKKAHKVDKKKLQVELRASTRAYVMTFLKHRRELSLLSQQSNLTKAICAKAFLAQHVDAMERILQKLEQAEQNPNAASSVSEATC